MHHSARGGAIAWLFASCLVAATAMAAAENNPAPTLEFRVTVDHTTFKSRTEAVMMTYVIANHGQAPVWINRRFYINSEEMPSDGREVSLEVTSSTGERLPGTYAHETGLPKSDDFVLVQPGDDVTSERPRDLRNFVDLTTPDTYTVAAVYHNVFGKELGLAVFDGRLVAEPISITIVEEP